MQQQVDPSTLTQSLDTTVAAANGPQRYSMDWPRQLGASMTSLLAEDAFTDTTFVCIDGRLLSAHAVAVAAASPVLKGLLQKSAHGRFVLRLDGIPTAIFQVVLRFIYQGAIPDDAEIVAETRKVAELLQIPDLVALCDRKAEDGLSQATQAINEIVQSPTKLYLQQNGQEAMTAPLIDYNTNGHAEPHQETHTPDTRTMDYSTIDTAAKFLVPMLQQTADENNLANNVAAMQYTQSPVDSPCSVNSSTIQAGSYAEDGEDDKRKYKCDICSKSFTRARSLQEHRLIHTGARPFQCNQCPKSFTCSRYLVCHRRRHNLQNKEPLSLPVTSTNLINDNSQTTSLDAPHPTINTSSINTTTTIPGDLILTDSSNIVSAATALSGIDPPHKQQLQQQQQLMYPNNNGGTPVDSANPASTTSPQHIKTQLSADILATIDPKTGESSVKPGVFVCNICGTEFTSTSALSRHKHIHTGLRPYQCSQCSRSFRQPYLLHHHQRTHTGERPYKCTICDKAFSRNDILSRHMSIHGGRRPHVCSICNLCFGRSDQLARHMKSHANQQQSQQQQQQQQDQHQQQINPQQSQTGQLQHQQIQHQLLQGKQNQHDPTMAPGDPNMTSYDPQQQLHLATGGSATQEEGVGDMVEMEEEEEEDVGGQALFECEVCEASFWNQEQLAEHMVTSGHRNKQVSTVNVSQLAND